MFQVLTLRSTSKQASLVKLIAEIPEQAIEEIISIRICGGVCAFFIQKLELQVWHHMNEETEQSLKHVEMLLNLWHVYPLSNSVWSFSEKRKLASLCSLKLKKYIFKYIYIKNSQKRKSLIFMIKKLLLQMCSWLCVHWWASSALTHKVIQRIRISFSSVSMGISPEDTVVKDTDQQLDNMGSNSSAVQNWKGNNVQININMYKT